MIKHVLQRFGAEEQELVAEAVEKMADALELWLQGDMDAVMQEYNKSRLSKNQSQMKLLKNKFGIISNIFLCLLTNQMYTE